VSNDRTPVYCLCDFQFSAPSSSVNTYTTIALSEFSPTNPAAKYSDAVQMPLRNPFERSGKGKKLRPEDEQKAEWRDQQADADVRRKLDEYERKLAELRKQKLDPEELKTAASTLLSDYDADVSKLGGKGEKFARSKMLPQTSKTVEGSIASRIEAVETSGDFAKADELYEASVEHDRSLAATNLSGISRGTGTS
jgi:hypothetical protein